MDEMAVPHNWHAFTPGVLGSFLKNHIARTHTWRWATVGRVWLQQVAKVFLIFFFVRLVTISLVIKSLPHVVLSSSISVSNQEE